jgi:hypothetical protein
LEATLFSFEQIVEIAYHAEKFLWVLFGSNLRSQCLPAFLFLALHDASKAQSGSVRTRNQVASNNEQLRGQSHAGAINSW